MELVSIVISAYNPDRWLLEAIASARAQSYPAIEIVLVNDGTDRPGSLKHLAAAAALADVNLDQPNRGLPAARNAGIRASAGNWIVPLDDDDLLEPAYVTTCMEALRTHSDAAFAYSSYRVFGTENRAITLSDYNLYHLLDQNAITYAALLRKQLWEDIGGYDEAMRFGYEDWEFWLRAGARGGFGVHVPRTLFAYRKQGPSLFDVARSRHSELKAYIEGQHPELFAYEARTHLKTRWAPAVSIAGRTPPGGGILDVEVIGSPEDAGVTPGRAPAVLIPNDALEPESSELAAMAVWFGASSAVMPDGSVALSRSAAARANVLPLEPSKSAVSTDGPGMWPGTLHTHLRNAELLSWKAWAHYPSRSFLRLVPLRLKERVNATVGRPVFDLSFYHRFQPAVVWPEDGTPARLDCRPPAARGRRRVALLTPHLGAGGAENVLDIAAALPRDRYQVLVIATHSTDRTWVKRWRSHVDYVYDLAPAVPIEHAPAAAATIVANWQCDVALVQNTLPGYLALPHMRKWHPSVRLIDITHAVDDRWDQVRATAPVAKHLDLRLAVTPSVQKRLAAANNPDAKIRLTPNGVDLSRFRPAPTSSKDVPYQILFAGRLDPVKRPLLLVPIAERLLRLRPDGNFRIVVVGEGSEAVPLRKRIASKRLERVFDLKGYVDDLAGLIQTSNICVLPSRSEGLPLSVLESMACARPVVASDVGGVGDVLDADTGILIARDDDEIEQFAAAIHRLLDSPALRERLGAAGRCKAEAFYDQREARRRYLRVFDELLSDSLLAAQPETLP